MPRRKIEKEGVRKLQHSNGTYYVTLPVAAVRALGWQERQKVVVQRKGKTFVIADWKG